MSSTGQRIGISLGDPAGIGPEIVAETLAGASPERLAGVTVFGDAEVLERAMHARGQSIPPAISITGASATGTESIVPGVASDAAGAAQVAYLEAAAGAARDGRIDALVTAPISKATARRAGFAFPGHTEFLADRLGADRVAMMFAGPSLRVVLATIHVGIADVPRVLAADDIVAVARLGVDALRRDFGVARPRVGVVGLNPHAGEGGLFGDEEQRVIAPAIGILRAALPDAEFHGPLVPDAAFRQRFDLFVAMYHDQGLIPIKLVDFEHAVNVTLGLPIVRTSPDHGVAYDIAGRGVARATSFQAAFELAESILAQRAKRSASAS